MKNSRHDNKYTDFNEWIDVVTKHINTLDWYNSNKIEMIVNNAAIDWDVFVNMLKKEYVKSGNVYDIFREYGYMYNSDFEYMTFGEHSNKHHRNAGCYPNGNLKLCWSSFTNEGEWNNTTKEGIGPLTQHDREVLTNEIYPNGSYKD